MKNKLLILIKKRKRIFLVITLLLVLLAVGIRILECHHKEFLFKQVVMNEYFKAGLFKMGFYFLPPFSTVFYTIEESYSLDDDLSTILYFLLTIWEERKEIIKDIYDCITFPLFFIKHYFFGNYKDVYIEEIKSPFFKKHILYRVSAYPIPDARWVYVAAVDIDRFKVHEIKNDVRCTHDIRLDQKVIKNFNELTIKEKIRIKSCEDCLEFIKTFFKLVFRERLIEHDEYSFKVYCHGHQEGEKKEHRKRAPFIFKPYGTDYYYVELYLPADKCGDLAMYIYFIKNTFKVKKNGIIYDFNEIEFGPVMELRVVEE